jgi:NRAMP (natural resistance-associated macrophage protein)-like metal ion transporter
MSWWKARGRSLAIFLGVLGPGIITAMADNDAGGIATYSLAGAHFGYVLLWSLIPTTVALVVIEEMCARMGAVTGKGLADLIRENFGVRMTFLAMSGLLVANLGTTMAEFAGLAAACEIFGVSRYISVLLGALLVWWLVVRNTYRRVEKIFLVLCAFYIAYVLSGLAAHPAWGHVLLATATPRLRFEPGYLVMLIALVGTTIAPWQQLYLQSTVVDKGITPQNYRYSRLDVIGGCIATTVIAFFVIVTCGATLFARGVRVESASQAAMALEPLAGRYASHLFAFGLGVSSLFAASILPLSTAYGVCEGMGWERGVDRSWKEAPWFNGLYTALIVVGACAVLLPNIPLLGLIYLSQVVNGVLLPFILVFEVILASRKELMGEYRNSRAFNWIAWATTVLMITLTGAAAITCLYGKTPSG